MVVPPRRSGEAGAALKLLVLSVSALGLTAVDLASGAVIRSAAELPGSPGLRPYDVVAARLAFDPLDPTQPEAVALAGSPRRIRRLTPQQADRWLRPLLHPERAHILGLAGPSIPFWELDGSRPSVAIVESRASVGVGDEGLLRCRFLWRTLLHDLPVAVRSPRSLPREAERVVIALTPPVEGHCYKVVTGLL